MGKDPIRAHAMDQALPVGYRGVEADGTTLAHGSGRKGWQRKSAKKLEASMEANLEDNAVMAHDRTVYTGCN